MTMRELKAIENRCRYRLAKRGMTMQKQKGSEGLYWPDPSRCRYRITNGDRARKDTRSKSKMLCRLPVCFNKGKGPL